MTALLLGATLVVPLALLAACASPAWRDRMPKLLVLAPLPGLAAALFAADAAPWVIDADRLRFTIGLDRPAALLLGVVSLLWSLAGAYANAYLGEGPHAGRFSAWWLLTLAGSLGVFVAGDLVSFYLVFAMASLAAFGLVVHDGTAKAQRAAKIYLLLAVLGEIVLLLAFALLAEAAPGDSLAITDVLPALAHSPWRGLTIALLIAGFGLKAGLVPLHVWLPLAHPAAPMPASAVLSGAIIKAGIIGLIRFLPYDGSVGDWGCWLAAVGFVTAFWGVGVGITQSNPKTVLAYSSVSQMGVVAAVLGMGLVAGDAATTMNAAFYAAHHVLAKGALFLVVGVAALAWQRSLRLAVIVVAVVLALGFGGLPLTGGALAKAAVKDELGSGMAGALSALSAVGSTMLMLHFVHRLHASMPARGSDDGGRASPGLLLPGFGLAAMAVFLPWLLFGPVAGHPIADLFAPAALWSATWPVMIGMALAAAVVRWGGALPRIPEGDLLVPAERAAQATVPLGSLVAKLEGVLRSWPAAGLALLSIVALLGAALMSDLR